MTTITSLLQFIVAISVLWVWVMRQEAVSVEFQKFGLSGQTRTTIGAIKTGLALMMIYSIWNPLIAIPSTAGMAMMMLAAQYYHMRFNSSVNKRIPSLILLLSCYVIMASLVS